MESSLKSEFQCVFKSNKLLKKLFLSKTVELFVNTISSLTDLVFKLDVSETNFKKKAMIETSKCDIADYQQTPLQAKWLKKHVYEMLLSIVS